ncbi:MAG: hypothetical protein WDZ59_04990 [Pirellulales bacterium]
MKRTVLYTTLLALGMQLAVANTAQADKGNFRSLSRGRAQMSSSMNKSFTPAKSFSKVPAVNRNLNKNLSNMKFSANKGNLVRPTNPKLNNLSGRLPVQNLVGKPNLGGVKKPFPTKLPTQPIRPIIKPLVKLPPFVKNPPVKLPPVVRPPIGKPPIKLPPIVQNPPIKLPPGIKNPPIKLPPGVKPPILNPPIVKPPVVDPPIVVPPICPPVDPPYCPPNDFPNWCFPGWTLPSWCYTIPYNCPPSYGTGIVDVSVVNHETIVETTAPAATPVEASDAGSVEVGLPQVPAGSTITVHGTGFGEASGVVMLAVNELTLPTRLVSWEADAVTITLLPLHTEAAVAATLIVLDAEGNEVQRNEIELVSAQVAVASN